MVYVFSTGWSIPCSNCSTRSARPARTRVVRCQDGGKPVLAMQPLHQLKNGHCVSLVQVSGGFIGQQKGRMLNECAGDRHALLLPSGQLPRTLCNSRSQADFPEPAFGGFERLIVPCAAHQQRHRHVLGCRKVSQKVVPLPHKTNRAIAIIRKLTFPKRIYRFLFEVYCTACWRV